METYIILNCIVLLLVVTGLLVTNRRPGRSWLIALAGLLLLTGIFDSLIVGFGIVGYDSSKILGIYVGNAPIEDFFYPLTAALIVPALWEKKGRRG